MLADTIALMNYHHPNMTTAAMQPSSASISLPPISSIDFHSQQAHHNPPDVLQPQPPRQLPPLPQQQYYNGMRSIPQEPQYVQQQRAIYPGMQVGHPYGYSSTRIPLPSTADPNLIVTHQRHKAKEVKRRTKTGCMTCRKRRIKVSQMCFTFSLFYFHARITGDQRARFAVVKKIPTFLTPTWNVAFDIMTTSTYHARDKTRLELCFNSKRDRG